MKTLKLMLLSAGIILSATPALNAQQAKIVTSDQDGWRKVAETTVDFEKDKDVLMVFGKDRFSKLQFMVMDAPIEITNMVVYYEGGTRDTINIASRIEEGGRSRVIDMAGGKPEIGRIVFNYKTSNENWNSSSSMSTDKTTRSASTSTTKKSTTDDKTSTNVNDNTSTYGNSNTITGSDNRSNTSGTTTTTTPGNTTTTSGNNTYDRTSTNVNDNTSTGNTVTGSDNRSNTNTGTTTGTTGTRTADDMNNTSAANNQNKNTSKAAGESQLNRSTKARVILWGMK